MLKQSFQFKPEKPQDQLLLAQDQNVAKEEK